MECIIYYSRVKSYSKLQPVSPINEETILKAKLIRKSIGEQNYCWQQCNNTPTPVNNEKHQLYRVCDLKFTRFNGNNPVEKIEMRKCFKPSARGLSKLNNPLLLLLQEWIETQGVLRHLNRKIFCLKNWSLVLKLFSHLRKLLLWYKNYSINFHYKSINWFLFDRKIYFT